MAVASVTGGFVLSKFCGAKSHKGSHLMWSSLDVPSSIAEARISRGVLYYAGRQGVLVARDLHDGKEIARGGVPVWPQAPADPPFVFVQHENRWVLNSVLGDPAGDAAEPIPDNPENYAWRASDEIVLGVGDGECMFIDRLKRDGNWHRVANGMFPARAVYGVLGKTFIGACGTSTCALDLERQELYRLADQEALALVAIERARQVAILSRDRFLLTDGRADVWEHVFQADGRCAYGYLGWDGNLLAARCQDGIVRVYDPVRRKIVWDKRIQGLEKHDINLDFFAYAAFGEARTGQAYLTRFSSDFPTLVATAGLGWGTESGLTRDILGVRVADGIVVMFDAWGIKVYATPFSGR